MVFAFLDVYNPSVNMANSKSIAVTHMRGVNMNTGCLGPVDREALLKYKCCLSEWFSELLCKGLGKELS